MQLAGKTAVITGAGRGLGRAIALAYAREGAAVVAAARSADEIAETVWLVEELGQRGLAVQVDIRDTAQINHLVTQALTITGRVDVLVNSAGVGVRAPFEETTEHLWDLAFDTLLKGMYLVTQRFLPYFIAQSSGNIINIGAPLERIAVPGFAAYCAAKYGVEGLTRVLAKEVRRYGINVNVLHPGGFVATRMVRETVPEVRQGLLPADSIDSAAIALAAQGPRGRTGQVIDARRWGQE